MARSANRRLRVAVVGGGLGGLTAALALARSGLEVHVFEQASELNEAGAGVGLTANAIKVLRELGLEGPLRRQGYEPQARVCLSWTTAQPVFSVPLRESASLYGAPHIDIHRADLLGILASDVPTKQIHLNRRCVDVSSCDDTLLLTFSDGRQEEADLVIGCDGIRSRVRATLHGEDKPRFTGNVCWRALIAKRNLPAIAVPPNVTIWMGPGGHVVTYYIRGGELLNVVAVKEANEWVEESWTVAGSRDDLMSAFADTHNDLRALLERVDTCFKWGLFDRDPLPVWGKGRITLLGDAAHPMLPFLGQGAAMAIEDACVLARALTRHASDVQKALRAYESMRTPRTTQVQLASRGRQRRFHHETPTADGLGVDWIYKYDPTCELAA